MKAKTQSQLHKIAWKLMSEFVRRSESDWKGYGKCVTCGAYIHYKEANAGHFIHKDCLDFDIRNIHFQCVRCNKYLSGNLIEYTLWMIKKYGKKVVEELRQLGHQTHYFTVGELKEKIDDLKSKLANLSTF